MTLADVSICILGVFPWHLCNFRLFKACIFLKGLGLLLVAMMFYFANYIFMLSFNRSECEKAKTTSEGKPCDKYEKLQKIVL